MKATWGLVIGILGALVALTIALASLVDDPPTWMLVTLPVVGALITIAKILWDYLHTRANEAEKARRQLAPVKDALVGHFESKARGGEERGPEGWFFTGREEAIRHLAGWLLNGQDYTTRVLTGDPGSGKSAVLGRLVTLSDPQRRQAILDSDPKLAEDLRFGEVSSM